MPAPTPAAIAVPKAAASFTTGTFTGIPSTSDRICGHSFPLAAPPAKITSEGNVPVRFFINFKFPSVMKAAFSSIARNSSFFPHLSASKLKFKNEGAA
ncbi:Uncharacterised protein [Streptococcus pneumoniae]|nr:Uncharacterised protein [Streptococcus pneumoniae]CJG77878.1 Uncharacterised protein [Streptococcus pneumoniae]